MRKDEELRNPNSCLNRAKDDEIIFVLLERDASAPDIIRDWCRHRIASGKNKAQDREILEAYHDADEMDRARRARYV